MADKKAQLIIEGAAPVELPILTGTVGPDVIDVRGLTATGRFTFDPGFMSTASCESKITYIDGDNGILLHRGYPIEQLAEKSDYLETCYLLLNGELPTAEQKAQFVSTVKNHTMVHEQLKTFFNGFRRDAHPMAVMCGVVGALSAFYHDSLDINNPQHREISAIRLVAKMPTLAWVAALLSVLLSLDGLFRSDFEDGSLEQWVLSSHPLALLVLAKVLAHWVFSGLALVLLAPLLALMLGLPSECLPVLLLSLLLGTPVLSLLGAVGAALTVGLKRGGLLLALLILPLYIPVLILGSGALQAALQGMPATGYLLWLGSLTALAVTLTPFAIAAGLKISVGE